MKYIVAVISFLFSWLGVAFLVGIAMFMIFPPQRGTAIVGVTPDLRNLPGNILGILAGIHSAKVSLRSSKRKHQPKESS